MAYIDGFLVAVPTAKKELYKQHSEAKGRIFKEYGALRLVECWGVDVPEGKVTSFPMAVKCQPDETVVFSWILWPSRQVRDEGMAKVNADPRLLALRESRPQDGTRMVFGRFEVMVDM